MIDPAQREISAVHLLDAWPWDKGGVLIGGYAISAYGSPRYSDDLDVVIPAKTVDALIGWLRERGFEPIDIPEDLQQNYGGRIARLQEGDVTVDLLPGSVRDREARIDIPERWTSRDPRDMRLFLLDASTSSKVPVARPEALWALKLQAGRPQDMADLFAIRKESVNLAEVHEAFSDRWCQTLAEKLAKVRESLRDPKLYADTLSRLALGSPKEDRNNERWSRFEGMVREAIPGG